MELVVRTFDKYDGDDVITKSKSKVRGDVVETRPDGFEWGARVRTDPSYVILRVIDLPRADALAMKTPELGDAKVHPALKVRQFKVDLEALTALGYPIPDAEACEEARFPGGKDSDEWLKLQPRDPIVLKGALEFAGVKVNKGPSPNPTVLG